MGSEKNIITARQQFQVVGIGYARDIPAVAEKTRRHILGESDAGRALDADVVVVVNPAQVGKLEVAGQGRRLAADPFHHVAVAAQGVHLMLEQIVTGTVVSGRQPAFRDGHADARRHALPKRPVVVSTPEVQPYSGWPVQRLPA